MYLAEHPDAGKALFTQLADARRWAERQHAYHRERYDTVEEIHDAAETRWVDGGHHGWHSLRSAANARRTYAEITTLIPDRTLQGDDRY